MEEPNTPATRLRAKLESIIHQAPLMSNANAIALGILIESQPILQQALGTIMHWATQRALELRNFNMAQEHGNVLFAQQQGFAQGTEAVITTLLNMIQASQEIIDEKNTQSTDEE